MEKDYLLHEGKAKKVYTLQDVEARDHLLVEFKDTISAFNGRKVDEIHEKGIMNNKICSHIFSFLEDNNISTHFLKRVSDREMLVKRVQIIPLEVVVRNIVSGSLIDRLDFAEGTYLEEPVVEFYYKQDKLDDPMLNYFHIKILDIATGNQVDNITRQALKINDLLVDYFARQNLLLVDYKIEFGWDIEGNIILADEISPDVSRLWDSETHKKLDKDRFRYELGEVIAGYREVLHRLSSEVSGE